MIQKVILGVLLISVAGLGYAVSVKPKEIVVTKETIVKVPKKFGFESDEERTEVLSYTESELSQINELGLAVIEHDESRNDTIKKKNAIGIKVDATIEVKWKARYKFGIDLNENIDVKFDNEILFVNVPKVKLLSAELLGSLRGKVINKGWGIDEKRRLKQLTQQIPVILRERGKTIAERKEVEALVRLGLEKHIRKIFSFKSVEVGEISISFI